MTLVKENEQEMTLAKVKEQYGKIAPQVLMPLGKYQLAGTHKFIHALKRTVNLPPSAAAMHFCKHRSQAGVNHKCTYMLLHPCEGYIRFTSTEPEGVVLVNQIQPSKGCNNEFISC